MAGRIANYREEPWQIEEARKRAREIMNFPLRNKRDFRRNIERLLNLIDMATDEELERWLMSDIFVNQDMNNYVQTNSELCDSLEELAEAHERLDHYVFGNRNKYSILCFNDDKLVAQHVCNGLERAEKVKQLEKEYDHVFHRLMENHRPSDIWDDEDDYDDEE